MRKTTLLGISTVISVILVVTSLSLIDYFDYTGEGAVLVSSPFISGAVLTPVMLLALTPFNRKLLAWRKSRGRDVEEEEKFESPSGMISLTRRDDE